MNRLVSPQFVHWDYVILTASNEQQAEGFEAFIEKRRRPPVRQFMRHGRKQFPKRRILGHSLAVAAGVNHKKVDMY